MSSRPSPTQYVITSTTPIYDLDHRPVYRPARREVTRRIVATLDEAREAAIDIAVTEYIEPDMRHSWANACRAVPPAGGTVGPLPDGTIIEVEPV